MTSKEFSGPVKVEGMVDFLHTLEGEVYVSQSTEDYSLSGDIEPDTAAEYLEGIVNGEAEGSARPWRDYEGNGLLDPESLEPWSGDSHMGELQVQSQELTEDGVSGGFDYKAVDGESEECDITIVFEEENYDGAISEVSSNAYLSKALTEIGL